MAKIIDSMGRESAAQIAEEDAIVVDPYSGTTRRVRAGQAIPGGLEEPYRIAVESAGKSKKKK